MGESLGRRIGVEQPRNERQCQRMAREFLQLAKSLHADQVVHM